MYTSLKFVVNDGVQLITHVERATTQVEKYWQDRVKRILKAELTRRGVSYRELADRLQAMGITDSERNISNKISRGGFKAAFFIQVMDAIGCRTLRLDDET